MHEYEDEVGKRWGDTDAYQQSQAKTSKYSKDDFQAAKVSYTDGVISSEAVAIQFKSS